VTDPSCRWVRTICPGRPGRVRAELPNQRGTLAVGPASHLIRVPTLAFKIVVVPETVIGPAVALLLEPHPATPTTASNAKTGTVFTRWLYQENPAFRDTAQGNGFSGAIADATSVHSTGKRASADPAALECAP
jgi:hypothetical protein